MINERDPQDDLFTAGIYVTCSPALKAQDAEAAGRDPDQLALGLICLLLEQRISRRRKRECRPS